MKSLEEYLTHFYKMEITEDPEEGGYVISFPDLPGCITCGETLEVAIRNGADAKEQWILSVMEDGFGQERIS